MRQEESYPVRIPIPLNMSVAYGSENKNIDGLLTGAASETLFEYPAYRPYIVGGDDSSDTSDKDLGDLPVRLVDIAGQAII